MENINVVLRMRPLSQRERERKEENVWKIVDGSQAQLKSKYKHTLSNQKAHSYFNFDRCYSETDNNRTLYENSVQKVVLSSLKGINGCVFMYGQSGAGKTYTMMGYEKKGKFREWLEAAHRQRQGEAEEEDDEEVDMFNFKTDEHDQSVGVLVLALQDLLQRINADLERTYMLRCSYVEIYNDQIHDLLKLHNRLGETLSVAQDSRGGFYIKGVTEESVSTIRDVLDLLG